LQISIRRMWLGAFTWMINASIATFVVRRHLQI
jgi:hypothetical protein